MFDFFVPSHICLGLITFEVIKISKHLIHQEYRVLNILFENDNRFIIQQKNIILLLVTKPLNSIDFLAGQPIYK